MFGASREQVNGRTGEQENEEGTLSAERKATVGHPRLIPRPLAQAVEVKKRGRFQHCWASQTVAPGAARLTFFNREWVFNGTGTVPATFAGMTRGWGRLRYLFNGTGTAPTTAARLRSLIHLTEQDDTNKKRRSTFRSTSSLARPFSLRPAGERWLLW